MKRKGAALVGGGPRKKSRTAVTSRGQSAPATHARPDHPVLRRLYPHVLSLRHYLLSRLPNSSRARRRRLSQLGLSISPEHASSTPEIDADLACLLDSTLVGHFQLPGPLDSGQAAQDLKRDIEAFTQQRSQGTSIGSLQPGNVLQSEVVDFVIWLLFKRSSAHKPSHILCHGFQRAGTTNHAHAVKRNPASSIPGLVVRSRNGSVDTLKKPTWCRLLALLGQNGDRIMMDLLVDCAVFSPVAGDLGNYYQLSGRPVSELKPDPTPKPEPNDNANNEKPAISLNDEKSPSAIAFVRSRMLYAKPALNAKGGVRFGMRHLHVLNRFPKRDDHQQTVHIMRYIFPRQFGLHNAFTSKVDPRETAMPFKDYTLREKEIQQSMCRELGAKASNVNMANRWKVRLPKRLRGNAIALMNRLRTLHHRCSYTELLRHYCPVEDLHLSSKPEWRKKPVPTKNGELPATSSADESSGPKSVMDMACPTAHVSAFCRAVVARVIPRDFWGNEANERVVMLWIDQFIHLRKFESLTLHQVTQKIEVTALAWLRPPGTSIDTKLARSDFGKRREIFLEFVYWIFDSFLIPLLRSNFHITESNIHRHRLFYFRHDVWRMFTEPSLNELKVTMFEPMPTERITKLLSMRPLGFSKVRLLPKANGFRTIMNLKRRQQVLRYGKMSLGRSINSVMTPVFNVITYEKSLRPERFGCSLFSVTDILPKLAEFKVSLQEQGLQDAPLYFAKVDVQSCFDTIPQSRLLGMIESLLSLQSYQAGKHVEISPLGALQSLNGKHTEPLPVKRYVARSGNATDTTSFSQLVQDKFVGAKKNTVFVNTNLQQQETKEELMHLLREHVERNLVKIGKRFYRQKTGIPQGSILSSILCNFFYAELERDVLSFVLGTDSLLLRLLDDFLLITTNQEHAKRFVRVMHRGHKDYGVVVKPAKSLTNFDASTDDGTCITRATSHDSFPYCGIHINTKTLDISKKSERPKKTDIEDSLTVDLSRMPGQTFHRKALNGFKIQLKAMFIDMSLNSVATVLGNLYQSFLEAAVRCLEYVRVLSKVRRTCSSLLISKSIFLPTWNWPMAATCQNGSMSMHAGPVRRGALTQLGHAMLQQAICVHHRLPLQYQTKFLMLTSAQQLAETVNSIIALAYVMLQRGPRSRHDRQQVAMQKSIPRRHLEWLACRAFLTAFQQKQTQHRVLLAWLQKCLSGIRLSDIRERRMLEAAVVRR